MKRAGFITLLLIVASGLVLGACKHDGMPPLYIKATEVSAASGAGPPMAEGENGDSTAGAPATTDKPYEIIDGTISANAIEGWKTYNGGGCGTCHGKGGIGAVGPNLAESMASKLSRDEFMNIVINGKPGTMMRPNKTNKRVMDNLDNLYAYLVARGDNVLGPENLIKFPMGKK